MDFKFFREHFKTACGTLVVPGAVVGNHCLKPLTKSLYLEVQSRKKHLNVYRKLKGPIVKKVSLFSLKINVVVPLVTLT